MKIFRLPTFVSLIVLLVTTGSVVAQTQSVFFRVVSTQETAIVSIDVDTNMCTLTWSNSISGASCQLEASNSPDGPWTDCPYHILSETGNVVRASSTYLSHYEEGMVLVSFNDNTTLEEANALMSSLELQWTDEFPTTLTFYMWTRVNSGTLSSHIAALEESDIVDWAKQRANPADPEHSSILIRFNTSATEESAHALIDTRAGLTWFSTQYAPKWGVVFVPSGEELNWIALLEEESIVESADLNHYLLF